MMRPLGLYLAEFRPAGSMPSFGALPLLPDLREEPAYPALDGPPFTLSEGEAAEFPMFGVADADPPMAFDAPAEPAPDLAEALQAQAAEHEVALAAARAQWATEQGAVLAERIGQAFADMEARLAEALAPLLEPFLAKAAQAKVLGQLHDMLVALLNGGDTRAIAVSGPADLVAALRDRIGDRSGLDFAETEAPDVTVSLGDTRIRSQLRAWTRKLESALGAQA